ncbi:hypothetical protein POPTR_002G262101v4 [Populus trichocarpa]|uniref:Uncharacterized protein n=1 Tax=Populus trichocarpa TaxID=3694 RepID=A0ACC0TG90_POPTR|nr:hypothetical protein BDE02_02G235100 [Populus trichocarpa]KAI9400532.1 hypothetical protein POPTR_002G262101v4 [Populus trichocarpa]
MASSTIICETQPWKDLKSHVEKIKKTHLRDLLSDADRCKSTILAGFFIGDGAGVGKGRTIAGLIWESWHHTRRKALLEVVRCKKRPG